MIGHSGGLGGGNRSFCVLLVLAACFYTIRVTDLSIRGEESRRGRIAWEIWQSGDWIVPRIQGSPSFSGPRCRTG